MPQPGQHRAVVLDPAEKGMHAGRQVRLEHDRLEAIGLPNMPNVLRKPCDPLVIGQIDIAADHGDQAIEMIAIGGQRIGGIDARGKKDAVNAGRRVNRVGRLRGDLRRERFVVYNKLPPIVRAMIPGVATKLIAELLSCFHVLAR